MNDTTEIAQEQQAGAEDGGFAALDASELTELAEPRRVDASSPPETAADPAPSPDLKPADAAPSAEAVCPPSTPAGVRQTAQVRGGFARLRAVAGRHRAIACAGAAALVLCLAGAWLYDRYARREPSAVTPAGAPASLPTPVRTPDGTAAAASESAEWAAVFREVDAFRARLSARREEILRLKQHYEYGVRELEEEAVYRIKEAGAGSPAAALRHKPIELLLTGIQRRQAYRDALEQPLKRLELGREELLFLERRARIDLLVSEAAAGIDMAEHRRAIEVGMAAHAPAAEALRIPDLTVAGAPDALLRRLAEEARQKTFTAEERLAHEITAEVCSGHLGRAAELTILTLKGAGCLAESGSRELFLNRLSQLTPLAAGKLAEWPGRWLGLNGLKRLPVEAARALFAWPGDILSLNGLTELTPEAAQYLTFWRGRQLELAGLRKGNALEALADWEALGGRLFVPGDIRRQLDQFRRTGSVGAERGGRK